MRLTFDAAAVRAMIEATEQLPPGHVPYTGAGWGVPEERKRGLNMVGDQGVYLMMNTDEVPTLPGIIPGCIVVYADQVSPFTMDLDEWYGNKRASFGGDDGVEFIPLDTDAVQSWKVDTDAEKIVIDVTPNGFSLHFKARRTA